MKPYPPRIETAGIDIAPNYTDWRDLGFALADALGESGRSYYHHLSQFYPKYNQTETDKQYNNCLKAHGHGVTIKTLYHLAKSAGIEIAILPKVVQGERRGKTCFNYAELRPTLDLSIIQNGNLAKVAKLKIPPSQKTIEKRSQARSRRN